eukprot:scaffold146908_cov14-Tisochrysis_lutea.AAC.2
MPAPGRSSHGNQVIGKTILIHPEHTVISSLAQQACSIGHPCTGSPCIGASQRCLQKYIFLNTIKYTPHSMLALRTAKAAIKQPAFSLTVPRLPILRSGRDMRLPARQ